MPGQKITAPFATPQQSADVLGVSKTRARRLVRLAREAAQDAESLKVNRTHAKKDPGKAGKNKG